MSIGGPRTQQMEHFALVAQKYGMSATTIRALYAALIDGGGHQAQFNLPELGGMGQWSSGGMIMIGDMFNHGLKAKVAELCSELSGIARIEADSAPGSFQNQGEADRVNSNRWYPSELGVPASSGSQNLMRYAFFPSSERLALSDGVNTTIYDTAGHQISGFSQQQGSAQDVSFTSQSGRIDLSSLRQLPGVDAARSSTEPTLDEKEIGTDHALPRRHPKIDADDKIAQIERLANLHAKGILTDEEFTRKKTELLSRI